MPRQAHLPPRYPYQKKTDDHHLYKENPHNYKSISQRFIKEEQPTWIDDLLDDSESNSSTILHRVSATGSVNSNKKDTYGSSYESNGILRLSSMYGPNSPLGGLGKPMFQENDIASALSEYVRIKHKHKHIQNLDETFSDSMVADFELGDDTFGSNGEVMLDNKLVKRHPGQRSRIRKLQYIAELERTVDMLQEIVSDMATKVSCLIHQRLSLSAENTRLKQRIVRLQQRKLIADGQTQTLMKEYEMLKHNKSYYDGKNKSLKVTNSLLLGSSVDPCWQMLDIGKLNLN